MRMRGNKKELGAYEADKIRKGNARRSMHFLFVEVKQDTA
jgi:hypothetical protein